MPKANGDKKVEVCHGGNSFGCKHDEHPISAKIPDIFCYRCDERMGCYSCVQIARELLCLRCHDWATRIAMRVHGPIVRDRKVGMEALRMVKMVLEGKLSAEDGEKLINDLMAEHNQPQRLRMISASEARDKEAK